MESRAVAHIFSGAGTCWFAWDGQVAALLGERNGMVSECQDQELEWGEELKLILLMDGSEILPANHRLDVAKIL